MEKTLGGDRLGSGNKLKVELHNFERSTHDLSYIWRSTMAPGTLVPFMKELALPGDTFDIHLNAHANTHPTVGPLFGSYKMQLDTFVVPIRLYNSATHNNMLNIGLKMSNVKLPQMRLYARPIDATTKDPDNATMNSSCIFSYLGIRGVALIDSTEGVQYREFTAVPWLMYWDIYKNYYSNKQEEEGCVLTSGVPDTPITVDALTIDGNSLNQAPFNSFLPVNGPALLEIQYTGAQPNPEAIMVQLADQRIPWSELIVGSPNTSVPLVITGVFDIARWGRRVFFNWSYLTEEDIKNYAPSILRFQLEDIDVMRTRILQEPPTSQLVLDTLGVTPPPPLYNSALRLISTTGLDLPAITTNQEGLGLKTYQSDLFNNWLSTEWIDGTGGINEITAIDTSSGSFNIDTLNLSKKVYDMLNRIAVSGGSYDDWINAAYGHEAWNRAESPVYMGGLIKEIVFQEVVSNASSDANSNQPLGTLAGKGVMGETHKGGDVYIKVDEPSYIIGIVSLTPRIDYSQGNKWDTALKTWDDFHKPNLDQIGFQELIQEQMAWWTTRKVVGLDQFVSRSAGKQPAWINYMTNVNEVRGNFAVRDNEMFMTLNRRYEYHYIPGAQDQAIIADMTTYIDPSKFNNVFAQTSLDAQNFWIQLSVDITARRKMSAKIMPNM